MSRSIKHESVIIILCAAIIFGIIAVAFMMDAAFGQTNDNTTTLITTATTPATLQEVKDVVEEVPAIVEQVDTNTSINALIGTTVTAIGGYMTTKFLKDRKDKEKIEEYSSQTDKIIFNHVMDNYNDFASFAVIEGEILDLQYQKGNEAATYKQLLDIVIDPVTGETYGMRKKTLLNNIVKWNKEYYGSPSTDPSISCPDPKNKIARTMTEIKKLSIPSTTQTTTATGTTTPTTV